jgi:hypothetical protein
VRRQVALVPLSERQRNENSLAVVDGEV